MDKNKSSEPMFSLANIYSKTFTTLKVTYGGNVIEFVIGNVIASRNKEELADPNEYVLLNSYLDYKGDEYKKKLFDLCSYIEEEIIYKEVKKDGIRPLPVEAFSLFLDHFDLNDIYIWLRDVIHFRVPSGLPEEFDPQIESDGRGTRVQTYLKSDYLELVAFCIVVKAVIGPIGTYASVKSKDVTGLHKELILFNIVQRHRIFQSDPALKLLGLIEKLVELPTNQDETDDARILERLLAKNDIPTYIFAVVVIVKLATYPIVTDDDVSHIVTKVYNYVNNRLKNKGELSKTIQPKTIITDMESGTGDKESIAESTRVIENISEATTVELNWCIDTVDKILKQLPQSMLSIIDSKVLIDAVNYTRVFNTSPINKCQIDLLSFIFKDLIDPRALDYIRLENIINLLSVGFAYLWGLGYKELAVLLIALSEAEIEETFGINLSTNKDKLDTNLKEELDFYFPYKRVAAANDIRNVVVETLTVLVKEIFSIKWLNTTDKGYYEEAYPAAVNNSLILPADIRNILAKFIIDHEKLRYK